VSDKESIIVSLKDPLRTGTWGLFVNDQPNSIPKLWLTEETPKVEISLHLLTETDLISIRNYESLGVINVEGLKSEPTVYNEDFMWQIPIEEDDDDLSIDINVDEMIELSNNIIKEEEFIESLNPKQDLYIDDINKVLSLPAHKCKKKLNELIKDSNSKIDKFKFLKECRDYEQKEKKRKTILALIVDLMVKQVSSEEFSRIENTKETLSDRYFDMIVQEKTSPTK
jgi:hypothetical protein